MGPKRSKSKAAKTLSKKAVLIGIGLTLLLVITGTVAYVYMSKSKVKAETMLVTNHRSPLSGKSYQRIPRCMTKAHSRWAKKKLKDQKVYGCFDKIIFRDDYVEVRGPRLKTTFAYNIEDNLLTIDLKRQNNKIPAPFKAAASPSPTPLRRIKSKDYQHYSIRNEGSLLQGMYGGVYRKIDKSPKTARTTAH